jgi:EAL domain-containing protein (putative c-di-GMP-specific phosphodiesterase class I)
MSAHLASGPIDTVAPKRGWRRRLSHAAPVPTEIAPVPTQTEPLRRLPDPEPPTGTLTQGTLEIQLRTALHRRAVQCTFRPIVRLDSLSVPGGEQIIAMQSLPRWRSQDGTDLDPHDLVAMAERIGIGAQLGMQMLDGGLDAVAAWYAAGFGVGRLSVRLGAGQLTDRSLPATLAGRLASRQLPGTCLVIEVDAAALSAAAAVRPVLTRLRAQGAEVIVTGVVAPSAALGLAHTLPLSGISLHRNVVQALTEDPTPAADAVAACRVTGLRCLAEQVVRPAELAAARQVGIDAAWGPLLGAPTRARDVSARLSTARAAALRG